MKLTKELVEGFLERYDGDLSEPILDIAKTLGWLGEVGGRVFVLGCKTLSYQTTDP